MNPLYEKLFLMYDQASKIRLEEKMEEISWQHMTLNHLFYLEAIASLVEPTLSELADTLKVSKPSVTTMVNKLIKEGIVIKLQSSHDKRIFTVSLTQLGKDIVNLELESFFEVMKELEENLSLVELEQFHALLAKGMANH